MIHKKMIHKVMIEFFSGSGNLADEFEKAGYIEFLELTIIQYIILILLIFVRVKRKNYRRH